MRVENKIPILPALVLTLALVLARPIGLQADPESGGGSLTAFSGREDLRAAVWQLAAFIPAGGEAVTEPERSLVVEGVKGLPPVTISLTFGEPLDPWPERLSLSFMAEASDPPAYFTLTDRRPFGGANIQITDPGAKNSGARKEIQDPAGLLVEILQGLNQRLLGGRPRLGPVSWRESAPGLDMARLPLLYGARLGPADLFLVRFDPAQYTLRPYHESEYPGAPPVDLSGWAERLESAVALINAGQYYPDRTYMGLLKRDGKSLSDKSHPQWKGFLAAEPGPEVPAGAPAAAVIDRQIPDAPDPDQYQNVMQSYMLLGQRGTIRVRDSYNLAGRAAVGQDREGRIVLIMTPAAVSLYDLALALKEPALGLAQVMGLDGGFEAQLLLRQKGTPFLTGGQFSISENRALYIPGYHATLPAVLAITPRQGTCPGPVSE